MQHAVSVSPWGFIQVVIASTIRAKGTLFLRCKVGDSLHPWMVWGLLPVWNARVYYWYGRMTAGGRPSQLPAAPELSCARLRPRPGSLKTVNTHQLRPDRCNRRTLTPGPESHILLLPWQPCRQSETQCNICCDHTRPADLDTSLSVDTATMYTLSDIWTDDFYKVGELQ